MIGSCHTIDVQASTINRIGCFGYRRHSTTNATTSRLSETMVPICSRPSQWVHPKSGRSGRGAPWTAVFLIRAATAPWRALCAMKSTATTNAQDSRASRPVRRSSWWPRPSQGRERGAFPFKRLSRHDRYAPNCSTSRETPNSGSSVRATR